MRLLAAGVAGKLLVSLLEGVAGLSLPVRVVDGAATVALVLSIGYLLWRGLVWLRWRLLWRIRRKLILSYVFIGFVPVLLIAAFFLFGGLLMFLNVSSYLFKQGVEDLIAEAEVIADATVLELRGRSTGDEIPDLLARQVSGATQRLPGISMALVPVSAPTSSSRLGATALTAGPWRHVEPPMVLPAWVGTDGVAALLAYRVGGVERRTTLIIRAASLVDDSASDRAVIVDLPIDDRLARQLWDATGIELASVEGVPIGNDTIRPAEGGTTPPTFLGSRSAESGAGMLFNWVTFFDYTDWESGQTGQLGVATRVGLGDMFQRISAAQSLLGSFSLGDLFLVAMGVIAGLFLIIEVAALVMGFALARSITGSVHALFVGTQRVQRGDFAHRIPIRSQDQLGELADSFNSMTANIEELLQQAAEKKRLEEELRIARQIQRSLLPRDSLAVPGLAVTALCAPAREVGGTTTTSFGCPSSGSAS